MTKRQQPKPRKARHKSRVSHPTSMAPQQLRIAEWRQHLTGMRQVLDHLLAALDAAEALGAGPSPRHISASEFCRRKHISQVRLQAYRACGLPHHRDGKVILIPVNKADEWLRTNLNTPTVQHAVQKALAAARATRARV